MKDKPTQTPYSERLRHPLEEASVFTPEALTEAVRVERRLPRVSVPEVCLLDFDGDLTDWLIATGKVRRWESWACFHTHMEVFDVDGAPIGLIARTIGGPYAVLIAEQLAVCGAKVIIGISSAGRVSASVPLPALVVATAAIRDEGTSSHYLAPDYTVAGDAELAVELMRALSELGMPLFQGTLWTTDAPYRETASQLSRYAAENVLAVEMQAASLFAFAAQRNAICGAVAHVTNIVSDAAPEGQFDKGSQHWSFELFQAAARAGLERVSSAAIPGRS
jgi:uridine phosphorylase